MIIFSSEKPLKFLIENGAVFTIRLRKRKYPKTPYTEISQECLVLKRGGKCKFHVWILYLHEVYDIHDLSEFVIQRSGFSSAEEWEQEVLRLNRIKKFEMGYLYLVVVPAIPKVRQHVLNMKEEILNELKKIKEMKK